MSDLVKSLSDEIKVLQNKLAVAEKKLSELPDPELLRKKDFLLSTREMIFRHAQIMGNFGTWEYDFTTGRITWSDNLFKVFGKDPKEFTPSLENLYDIIHPEDVMNAKVTIGNALKEKQSYQVSYRIIRNGEVRHILSKAKAIQDQEGNTVMVIGSSQDITEKIQHENSLIESQEIVNRQNNILHAINEILKATLISPDEQKLGLHCLDIALNITGSEFGFIGEVTKDGLLEIALSHIAVEACSIFSTSGNRVSSVDFREKGLYNEVIVKGNVVILNHEDILPLTRRFPEGHPSIENLIAIPLHHEGKVLGMIALANRQGGYTSIEADSLKVIGPAIVEAFMRKRAEDALTRTFHDSPIATVLTTLPENRVFMVNAAFLRLSGYSSPEEVLGKTGKETGFSTPEDYEKLIGDFNTNKHLQNYECTRHRKDGSIIHLVLNVNIMTIRGVEYVLTTMTDLTERKKMENAIRQKEEENELLARVIQHSSQSMGMGRMDGSIFLANEAMQKLTGYSEDELKSVSWSEDLTPVEYREAEAQQLEQLIRTGNPVIYEKEYIRKDGSRVPIELLVHLMRDQEGNPQLFYSFINDISERKRNERNLHVLIRLLKAMQRSSQEIVKATDEKTYLDQVCRIIVEDCGHKMVWVGMKQDDPAKTVLPVAAAGFSDDYSKNIRVTWGDDEFGRGPTGTSIRTGKISICHDMQTDINFMPWREAAVKRGYASSMVLPLSINGNIFGALNIYSELPAAFSEEEQQLMMRLANDISHGITYIRLNKALKRSNEELEVKVEERTFLLRKTLQELETERGRLDQVLNMIPSYVVLINPDYRINFANKVFIEEFGEIGNLRCYDYLFGRTEICENCQVAKVFEDGESRHWEWKGPNGKYYDVYDFPFMDSEGSMQILEMGMDITEKKNIEKYVLSKILETEEQDRRRFASDLHDDLGPTLSAIKLQLGMLSYETEETARKEILDICDLLLTEGIDKMRTVANNIMPTLIESYGLETSIRSFINRFNKSSRLKFDFQSNLNGFRFDTETELHLYRITTELITNTVKHSGATEIKLKFSKDESVFRMMYMDNGLGYTIGTDPLKSGIGLRNIQNRATLIDANIEFINKKGKTQVLIHKTI